MSREKLAQQRDGCVPPTDPERRKAVRLLVATGVAAALPVREGAAADEEAATARPKAGDVIVFAEGEHEGQPIKPGDLQANAMAIAWPKDPASGTVRDGTPLNRLLVVKLDPASMDETTKQRSAEGVVAYSGFCTHAGCLIEQYKPDDHVIFCHCHFSAFDPREDAKVVGGPARRPLAGLPLKLDGDKLVAAGEFVGRLGPPKA
jgi:Rieske Fe-S protein